MIHTHCEDYRRAWDLYLELFGLNVVLFELLLIWVQLCLVIR